MDYLRVKNWENFQQYKDREPKWIKVYRELLMDYKFEQLTDSEFGALVKIWLLASQIDNCIPNDPLFIQRKCGLSNKPNIKKYLQLDFLQLNHSVQNCTELYLETETETETEKSRDRVEAKLPDWVSKEIWTKFLAHRKAKKCPVAKGTEDTFFKKFEKWKKQGFSPEFVVNTMIERGWQGFNPKWVDDTPPPTIGLPCLPKSQDDDISQEKRKENIKKLKALLGGMKGME